MEDEEEDEDPGPPRAARLWLRYHASHSFVSEGRTGRRACQLRVYGNLHMLYLV